MAAWHKVPIGMALTALHAWRSYGAMDGGVKLVSALEARSNEMLTV